VGAAVKATDEELKAAYAEMGSVHRVGDFFGMRGSVVHRRLQRIGIAMGNPWKAEDDERLKAEYLIYRSHGRVSELAQAMGRTVPFLSRKAGMLGLADPKASKRWHGHWKYMTEDAARIMFDDFKASSLALGQWCAKNGYDDDGFRDTMLRFWPDEWEPVIESKTPISTKYRLGRQVEYRFRDILRANGYFVMRSPASKTPIDLIAIKTGQVLMIQCKRSGALPVKEWNALYDLALSCGAVPLMCENPWPREHRFWRLTARKDGSRRQQPMVPFVIDIQLPHPEPETIP
jgi:Holliday junction resolvase